MSEQTLAIVALQFFALLVKADQKILKIETQTVEVFLQQADAETRGTMLNVYHDMLNTRAPTTNKICILQDISSFDQEEKLYILRCLWRLAVCDDELHHAEERIIYDYVDAVKIDRRTAIAVQASLG